MRLKKISATIGGVFMVKKLTRPVSVLLSVMMLIGIFTALPFTVHAATYSYVKLC